MECLKGSFCFLLLLLILLNCRESKYRQSFLFHFAILADVLHACT